MKTGIIPSALACSIIGLALCQCNKPATETSSGDNTAAESSAAGQSAVNDDVSQKDIVKVAVGSPAHTTLVTAVKAAELVDVLSNAGPFTVFAPTNDAFNKLPAGTVDSLLKPEAKDKLGDILQYHVAVGVYTEEMLTDGRVLNMANGGNVKVSVKDGKITLNGSATVAGSVKATNGLVYVVDGVLTPDSK
jgi:uncharacterized surface protein with fasciclin (FAS1) repeats